MIQHSHSPCVTPGFVVSKLDAFETRNPLTNKNSGLLKYVHQSEDNLWMVMDRKTNKSRIVESNFSFVNNHFWNCFEADGKIVVDVVAATSDYLDNYFSRQLDQPTTDWEKLFHPSKRCLIPTDGEDQVSCEPFFKGLSGGPLFDYPTYNPTFKMNPEYNFFYAIAAKSSKSRWFDQLIKVDAHTRDISKHWSSEGIFFTEADYISRQGQAKSQAEDSGLLVTVLYNSTADQSSLALFDASSLEMVSQYKLDFVIPFHAHGIVCEPGQPCYPNP